MTHRNVPTHVDTEGDCIATMDGETYRIGTAALYDLGPYIAPREHYALLRHTVTLAGPGTAIEFGVGAGESTRIIAERMPVIGFDSGLGLPEDWRDEYPKGSFACGIPSIPNTQIIEGWFADTLPSFDFTAVGPTSLVHIDCDLYSSTTTALEHIWLYLHPGTHVVFDEFHGYPGAENHEQRAWLEIAARTGIEWDVIGHSHEAWSIRIA